MVCSVLAPVHGRPCRRRLAVQASGGASGAGGVQPGQKVKVTAPVTVYHVPKTKGAATPLQGLHGVVTAVVDKHTDGSQLSCTMPLKVLAVELSVNAPDGKAVTFSTHLTADEVELVA